MDSLLDIVGIVAIAFLVILAIATTFFLVAFVRRLARKVGDGAPETVAAEIRLSPVEAAGWPEPELAERLVTELEGEGFDVCGTYRIDPLEGRWTTLLVGPNGRSAAAVLHHPLGGTWVDLWAIDAEGATVTHTSAAGPGLLEQPPWTRRVVRQGAPVAELVAGFRDDLPDGAVAISCETLPAHFVEDWRRAIVWQKGPGASPPEMGTLASRSKGD